MDRPKGPPPAPGSRPYPEGWDNVAFIRVFRTPASAWASLIAWRAEMRRKGWRLLQVTTEGEEIVAIFGRTREQPRQGEARA